MNRFRRCSFRLGLLVADIPEPDTGPGSRMQTRRVHRWHDSLMHPRANHALTSIPHNISKIDLGITDLYYFTK